MNKQMTDDDKLIQWVKKCRSKIYFSAPGTFSMMGGLPIELSTDIRTFATDGKLILVNREFAGTISDKDCSGIIIHESLHISNLHHLRNHNQQFPHELWNQATDYIINGWIKASENYGKDFTLPDFCLWDKKYSQSGWSAEKVAHDMMKNGWTPPPPPPTGGQPNPNGQPGPGGQQPSQGQGTPMPGQGQGQSDYPCGIGEILPSPANGQGDEAREAEEAEINQRVEDAAMIEKSMGQGKGGLCNKVIDSRDSTTTSGEMLRHFLRKSFSAKRSYQRPNRRFLHKRIYLPSKTKTPHTLYVAIDSSASVGVREFQAYRKNLVRWAKELGLNLIRVAYVDTYIHHNPETNEPWYDIDLKNGRGAEAMELDVYGGGGTSFDPIFEYIDEHNTDDIGALVYFTDGYGGVTTRNPSYPVMWVTSGCDPDFYSADGYDEGAPFGKIVEIHAR